MIRGSRVASAKGQLIMFVILHCPLTSFVACHAWSCKCVPRFSSANVGLPQMGGVTNGGLRGVWPPFPEIGRNRPFSPFFCLCRPFPERLKDTWKIQKTEEKGLFPQISSDFLKPPSLKPPFAAPQQCMYTRMHACFGVTLRARLAQPVHGLLSMFSRW